MILINESGKLLIRMIRMKNMSMFKLRFSFLLMLLEYELRLLFNLMRLTFPHENKTSNNKIVFDISFFINDNINV